METKEFTDLILRIRKDKKTKKTKTYIKKYICNNLQELKKDKNKLILLLKEGSNKTKTNIFDLIALFIVFSESKLKNKEFKKIVDDLSLFFNIDIWGLLSIKFCDKLSLEFMERHAEKLNWIDITLNSKKLPQDFIEKHMDKEDWNLISKMFQLPERFIERYAHKLNWVYLSRYQKLKESFIKKHADKVFWFNIFIYQKLSTKFRRKYESIMNQNPFVFC